MFIIISTRSRIIITEFKSLSTILQRLIVDVYEWQSEWQWLLLIAGNSLTLIDEFSNRIQWYNLTRKSSCMNFSTASSHTLWQRVSCSRENRWLCGDRTQHPCPNHRTHIQLYTAEKHRTIEKASQVLVRRNTCNIYIYNGYWPHNEDAHADRRTNQFHAISNIHLPTTSCAHTLHFSKHKIHSRFAVCTETSNRMPLRTKMCGDLLSFTLLNITFSTTSCVCVWCPRCKHIAVNEKWGETKEILATK